MTDIGVDGPPGYESPSGYVIGSFTDLTLANSTVLEVLDKSYPTGTPFGELTWSA
ncbi:MAG TPA: hypothetical protein VK425_06775 [Acidimicrobiales bacterium]|nr:hypothetical protein [Acidimicrobiales bacterium]